MRVLKQPTPIECLFTELPNQRMHPQNRCYLNVCSRSETPTRTIGKKEQEDKIHQHTAPHSDPAGKTWVIVHDLDVFQLSSPRRNHGCKEGGDKGLWS